CSLVCLCSRFLLYLSRRTFGQLSYVLVSSLVVLFFFQAEDGIRDRNVTGVQTCALPICLKFLLADWGPEKFRRVLEEEYLGRALPDGPAPGRPTRSGDHVGVHEQKDGRWYVGGAPYVGRVPAPTLTAIPGLADTVGSDRIRLTPHQKLLVLDVPAEHVTRVAAGLDALGLATSPSPFRRATIACTGIEYCKLAIVETKATAAGVVDELEQ